MGVVTWPTRESGEWLQKGDLLGAVGDGADLPRGAGRQRHRVYLRVTARIFGEICDVFAIRRPTRIGCLPCRQCPGRSSRNIDNPQRGDAAIRHDVAGNSNVGDMESVGTDLDVAGLLEREDILRPEVSLGWLSRLL